MSIVTEAAGYSRAKENTLAAQAAIDRFTGAIMRERGLSPSTLDAYRADLTALDRWSRSRGGSMLNANRADLLAFFAHRAKIGAQPRSMARQLSSFRRFYRYLIRDGVIDAEPTAHIEMPKIARPVPKSLTEDEVRALLAAPEIDDPFGLRDRAMLEVLYATGLRVTELVNLESRQVNWSSGVLRIIDRRNRLRLIPLGDQALGWLLKFVNGPRQEILLQRSTDYLFPTARGDGMTRQGFWYVIKRYAQRAGVKKAPSPHTLRHAFAIHALSHGADLRVLQKVLGHGDLSTTQVYAHVAQERLKELRAKHSPGG